MLSFREDYSSRQFVNRGSRPAQVPEYLKTPAPFLVPALLAVTVQGTTASTPTLLARQTNDPRQPITAPTIGQTHPILYEPPIPQVVPELMGSDHGAPEDLQFGNTVHIVYTVEVHQGSSLKGPESFLSLFVVYRTIRGLEPISLRSPSFREDPF
jgi:hypothetical protein